MATKYVDFDLATGDDDGTSWANAFQTPAAAVASAAAGDIMKCRGTATTVMTLATSGTVALPIWWIGVNSSGAREEGVYCTLDGTSTIANCLDTNSKVYNYFEAFEYKDATGINVLLTGGSNLFYDCLVSGAGSHGMGIAVGNVNLITLWRVKFLNNTDNGCINILRSMVINCYFNGNGGNQDLYTVGNTIISKSIFHDGAGKSIQHEYEIIIDQCIFNNASVICIQSPGTTHTIIKNSIFSNMSNATYGFFYACHVLASKNAFYNNSADKLSGSATYTIVPNGDADVTLTADPYENEAGDNLTIATPNADLTSIEVAITSLISDFSTIGIPPEYTVGGGNLIDGSMVR